MRMPEKNENHPLKRYYSIGEVAEMFDVSKSLIRFWESEFSLLRPHKNSKGDRRFTPQNIEQMRLIYQLVKERTAPRKRSAACANARARRKR